MRNIHALAAQATDDRRTEAVGADAADIRDCVSESSQPDRDVRLGAGDVALEGRRFGERSGHRRHERRQTFTKRHDFELCGPFHESHDAGPTCP